MRITEPDLLDIFAAEAIVDRQSLVREATLADIGVSSLDIISVLFTLEERYNVVLEGTEMPQMDTLGDLVDHLLGCINGVGEPA